MGLMIVERDPVRRFATRGGEQLIEGEEEEKEEEEEHGLHLRVDPSAVRLFLPKHRGTSGR